MAIIPADELNKQAELSYIRGTYYIALLYSQTSFNSASDYDSILDAELTAGVGGYNRLSYTYSSSDLLPYNNGQPLSQKIASFVHDGSSDDIIFTHVALLREVDGDYSVVGIESVGEVAILNNGKTASININVLHGRP